MINVNVKKKYRQSKSYISIGCGMCQKRSSPAWWKNPRAQCHAGMGWNLGSAKDSLYLPGPCLPHLENRGLCELKERM